METIRIKTKVKIIQLRMQTIINIGYMIIGIGLMILTISVGLIGFIKVWREINKIKDTKE